LFSIFEIWKSLQPGIETDLKDCFSIVNDWDEVVTPFGNLYLPQALTLNFLSAIITNICGYITNHSGDTNKDVGDVMLEPIVGSKSSEQVFIFITARENGYATEIARFFDADLYAIQRQLERLENAEVLVSRKVGRTRVFQFNPRYPFLEELKALLTSVLKYYPEDVKEELIMNRRRPRKKGKPL
jgi:hypothetical protein